LNGGLGKISPIYWVVCLLAAGAIDVYGISKSKRSDPNYFPGNLGFDPLGLYPKDLAGQERMQLAELKNGRLGMIAITAFAVQEFVSSLGVVDETPLFFKPLGDVLHEYANSGYYQ
jgi:Chlorophyll A-B binding protein